MTSLLSILLLLGALYLAFKLLESIFKVLAWVLVLVIIYFASASSMGWPPLTELVQMAWQDIQHFSINQALESVRELLGLEG